MKFTFRPSPSVRSSQSTQNIMLELTLGLLAVFAFGVVYYFMEYGSGHGVHALILMAVSVGVALLTELGWCLFLKKDIKKHLQSSFPWVTAIILTLMLPITTTYYAMAIGSFSAIFIGKLIFGGFGHNIFNPAGVGRGVMLTSFAGAVAADVTTGPTPIASIAQMGWLITDNSILGGFLDQFGGLWGLFTGWYPGAIGETSALLIIVVGVILGVRKVLDWKVPVFYVGTVFVLATVIALVSGAGLWYPMYHVLAGGLLFGAVFMATDPVTNPTSASGRIIFAIGAGILTILIRVQANLPGGVIFAILIMNIFTPTIERLTDGWQIEKAKKYAISIASLSVVGIAIMAVVGTLLTPVVPKEPEPEPEPQPSITLGDELKIFSADTERAPAEIISSSVDGDVTIYLVETKGYAILEGGYEEAKANVLEVAVNKAENKIVYVKVTELNDTAGIGDKVEDEIFLDQFEGLALDSDDIGVDVVTSATVTSVSVARGVRAVIEAVREGE